MDVFEMDLRELVVGDWRNVIQDRDRRHYFVLTSKTSRELYRSPEE